MHILDLVQNSIKAGAKNIDLSIEENRLGDTFSITIEDDGCGMSEEMTKAVTSPFVTSRTTRHVGLGIPLFKAGCDGCDGSFSLESEEGKGTRLYGVYRYSHIDRPPLGSIAETMLLLITGNPLVRFHYKRVVDELSYEIDTQDLWRIWEGAPVESSAIIAFLKDFFINNETELCGGA